MPDNGSNSRKLAVGVNLAPLGVSPEGTAADLQARMAQFLEKAGVGVELAGRQTAEEVNQRIREFRGDE